MNDQNKPPEKSPFSAIAMGSVVIAMFSLMVLSAFRAPVVDIANDVSAQSALRAAVKELASEVPALNSAGDHVYAELYVNDATGVVTTPLDAGVYTDIAATPLAAGEADGSGCITATVASGRFTVAKRCGIGELQLIACISNFASSSNVGGTTNAGWHVNGTILTTAPRLIRIEPVDAGNAQGNFGCSVTTIDADTVGDYITFALANAGGGITGTTRQGSFRVQKLLNK